MPIFPIIILVFAIAFFLYSIDQFRNRKFFNLTSCILRIIGIASVMVSTSLSLLYPDIKSINIVSLCIASMLYYPNFDALVKKSYPHLYKKNEK